MEERIKSIWSKCDKGQPPIGRRDDNGWWFYCQGMASEVRFDIIEVLDENDTLFRHHKRHERTVDYCRRLFHEVQKSVQESQDPFQTLDYAFCQLVQFGLDTKEKPEVITDRAYRILSRLPRRPQSLEKVNPDLSRRIEWDELSVVANMSTNTIRMALAMSCDSFWGPTRPSFKDAPENLRNLDDWGPDDFHGYLNTISEVLEEATSQLESCHDQEDRRDWFIVKSFLWSSWQRSIMLLFWYILDHQLKWGYVADKQAYLAVRRTYITVDKAIEVDMEALDKPLKSKYMCNWAYSLLRTDRCAMGLDFRRFHERFNDLFGSTSSRCLPDRTMCDGRSPKNCQRFAGAEVHGVNQSAHNLPCVGGCRRLYWDEKSFRSVSSGARAVCIQSTDRYHLRYTRTSERTMAISHVWNHGQGGRPEYKPVEGEEGGFNTCLHLRYSAIAKEFGCDSYWMDTPCIPADHNLRAEAIANINKVFNESKITLVCDKDLMTIDAKPLTDKPNETSKPMIELRESIIATILVSDWNVRSWTLLESMRGRKQIHLLCKSNQVVPLKEILEMTCQYGCIDIAILFLSSQHMLPTVAHETKTQYLPARNALEDDTMGFVSLEEAACLLNRRHASRENDDIVIWSLLCGAKPYYEADKLWHERINTPKQSVKTGFLLSSASRVRGVKGLRWAPSKPAFHLPPNAPATEVTYEAYDGGTTERATILKEGLRGKWGVFVFDGQRDVPSKYLYATTLNEIRMKFPLRLYGILLQPLEYGPDYGGTRKDFAACYRGSNKLLFGVGTSDDARSWEWVGVFQLPTGHPIPRFEVNEILLV